jgi:acetolactate synthase small subunit
MYGNTQYGRNQYAQERAGSDIPVEYFVDLSRYAPPFLAEIRELAEIYWAQGYEVGQLQHDLEDLIDQCYIVTATWGLSRWEQMLGVATNMSLTYEQRREILMAKLRGQGTTTRKMIEDTAVSFSGGEVKVIEDNPNHLFIIQFIGIKGIPRNMQAFVSMLEDIKPAHLAYRFEYRYTIWNEVRPYIWNHLTTITWDDVKTLKEA